MKLLLQFNIFKVGGHNKILAIHTNISIIYNKNILSFTRTKMNILDNSEL